MPRTLLSSRHGFSLFEIGLVLSIVGLLLGGVIAGKAMINQSKIQAITRDFTKYSDAYKTFLTQYGGKPGDFNTFGASATNIWGSAGGPLHTDDGTCFGALLTAGSAATCNGDGNNSIAGPYVAGLPGALTNPAEIFTAIQQLSNAKLIEGKFTGKSNGAITTFNAVAGVNVPSGPIANSGYAFLSMQAITSTNATDAPNYFYGSYGTLLLFGNADPYGLNELLSPKDAFIIDQKIDDGLPAMGSVVTSLLYPSGVANRCVISTSGPLTAASGRNAVYNASVSGNFCNLIYVIDTK